MAEGVHVTAEHNTVEPLHDARESYLANIRMGIAPANVDELLQSGSALSFENAVAFMNDIF